MPYDDQNVFAKIIRGEIPCSKVMENDDCLAIMDVMPQADGHILVIPKAPSRNLLDADPDILGPLIRCVQQVALAAKQAFEADGIRLQQFNEAPAGQSVFHLHFHVIPIKEGVPLRPHTGEMADPAALEAHAELIRPFL